MGDLFSSSFKNLVGRHLSLSNTKKHFIIIMKFFAFFCLVVVSQAFLVRREAEAEADADADAGVYGAYGAVAPAAVSAPVCNSVPEKVCKDRTIETPRKVCHQEYDEIVDTTITEHCEETITTTCEQTSSQTRKSSAIVGTDSKVVATGVVATPAVTVAHGVPTAGVVSAGYSAVGGVVGGAVVGGAGIVKAGYGKRDADAEPEADADADAGYVSEYASPVVASAPVCKSVPVKTCNNVPVSTPRKVGPAAVVATHGTVAVAAPAVAAVGVAAAPGPVVAGYAGTGYGLAGYGGW